MCEPYMLIARTKGILFWPTLQEHLEIVLPQRMLEKAVSNILANAVAYTKPGGTVRVYLEGRDFYVENMCDPIPEEDLRHLFQPFYRPD